LLQIKMMPSPNKTLARKERRGERGENGLKCFAHYGDIKKAQQATAARKRSSGRVMGRYAGKPHKVSSYLGYFFYLWHQYTLHIHTHTKPCKTLKKESTKIHPIPK
jgi:hypothetical protein